MSKKSMFANPKAALGFAGVTVAIAIVASFGASAFIAADDQPTANVVEADAGPAKVANAAQTPAPTWADEGLSDDWNTSAVDAANGMSGWGNSEASNDIDEPTFGEYEPQRGGPSATSQNRAERPSNPPRVETRAAPSAPQVAPPGGSNGAPVLDVVN